MLNFSNHRIGMGAVAVVASGLLNLGLAPARASTVYSQNFDTGSATFTVNDPFWVDPNRANGFITQTTNTPAIWPGSPNGFGNDIPNDVSGTGYFLFEGTYLYSQNNAVIPTGNNEFFISPTFAVAPATNYTVSFYLTNADAIAPPSVQPELGGSLLGSPVSPVGTFTSNGWQQFTFSWNSGANTSASLILHDYTNTTIGNDFGLDAIDISTVPEPSTFALVGIGTFGLALRRRRPRAL